MARTESLAFPASAVQLVIIPGMTDPQPVADAKLLLSNGLLVFDQKSKRQLLMVRNPETGEDELCVMVPPASARDCPLQMGKYTYSKKKDDESRDKDGENSKDGEVSPEQTGKV